MPEGIFNKSIYRIFDASAQRVASYNWVLYGDDFSDDDVYYSPSSPTSDSAPLDIRFDRFRLNVEGLVVDELLSLKSDLREQGVLAQDEVYDGINFLSISVNTHRLNQVLYENRQGFLGRASWKGDCEEKTLDFRYLGEDEVQRYIDVMQCLGVSYEDYCDVNGVLEGVSVSGVDVARVQKFQDYIVKSATSDSYYINGIFMSNYSFYDSSQGTKHFVNGFTGDVVSIDADGQNNIYPTYNGDIGMGLFGDRFKRIAKETGRAPVFFEGGEGLFSSYLELGESAGDVLTIVKASNKGVSKLFGKAARPLKSLSVALEYFDRMECLRRAEVYHRMGLLSDNAFSEYQDLSVFSFGIGLMDALSLSDKNLIAIYQDWVDEHGVSDALAVSINPGTATEAIQDIFGLETEGDVPNEVDVTEKRKLMAMNMVDFETTIDDCCPDIKEMPEFKVL